jgi:hypothetical protein
MMLKTSRTLKFYGIVLLALFSILTGKEAFAYDTYNDHVLTGGVGNYGYTKRQFFVTTSGSAYATQISSAMNDWIYTTSRVGITTPISFVKTTTQSASEIDFYTSYSPYIGANGWTEFWKYSSTVDKEQENWGWNKIVINNYSISYFGLTTLQAKGVIAHEIGHAFGLDHVLNPYQIMCTYGNGRAVTESQTDDLNGINHLY